jgi:hypothetical protein
MASMRRQRKHVESTLAHLHPVVRDTTTANMQPRARIVDDECGMSARQVAHVACTFAPSNVIVGAFVERQAAQFSRTLSMACSRIRSEECDELLELKSRAAEIRKVGGNLARTTS